MALNNLQKAVIEELAASGLRDHFYWTGGTLLSEKYLHHRGSQDIDFFSDKPFRYEDIAPMIKNLKKRLNFSGVEEKKIFDRWEFFLHNHEEVRVEFVHYDFPALGKREIWEGVYTDSLDDISANKVMALLDRDEPKDVFDIYFLIKKAAYAPRKLLMLAKKKFGVMIDESTLFGEALRRCRKLTYIRPLLEGSEQEQQQTLKEVKDYFENQSWKYLRHRFQ